MFSSSHFFLQKIFSCYSLPQDILYNILAFIYYKNIVIMNKLFIWHESISIISKHYEKPIFQRLYKFVGYKILLNTQFIFRKGLDQTDALLLLTNDMQSSLYKWAESWIVSFGFSSAFDQPTTMAYFTNKK